jgi:hypothetical protein
MRQRFGARLVRFCLHSAVSVNGGYEALVELVNRYQTSDQTDLARWSSSTALPVDVLERERERLIAASLNTRDIFLVAATGDIDLSQPTNHHHGTHASLAERLAVVSICVCLFLMMPDLNII